MPSIYAPKHEIVITTTLTVDAVQLRRGEGRIVRGHWKDSDGEIVTDGFIFDGASSPWFLHPFISPFRDLVASCGHDWDCHQARKILLRGGHRNRMLAMKRRFKGDLKYSRTMTRRRGKIIGTFAFIGVRIGSAFGTGWKHFEYEIIEEKNDV